MLCTCFRPLYYFALLFRYFAPRGYYFAPLFATFILQNCIISIFCGIILHNYLHVSYKSSNFAASNKKNAIMNKKIIFSALLAVASKNPDGFTVSANNLEPVQTGYAVALAATQNSHGHKGLANVIDYAHNNRQTVQAFGGWKDSESGLYYWDAVCIVKTRKQAERLAKENDQLAFFCLTTGTEYRCK